MTTMTLRVYRVGPDGRRQEISEETTEGFSPVVVDPGFPPCRCPHPACRRRLMVPEEARRRAG